MSKKVKFNTPMSTRHWVYPEGCTTKKFRKFSSRILRIHCFTNFDYMCIRVIFREIVCVLENKFLCLLKFVFQLGQPSREQAKQQSRDGQQHGGHGDGEMVG